MDNKPKRGLAAADIHTRSRVGRLGGMAPRKKPRYFAANPDAARKAGEKGKQTRWGKKEN